MLSSDDREAREARLRAQRASKSKFLTWRSGRLGGNAPVTNVTLAQAAAYLSMSIWAVRELVWKGTLPAVRINRRRQHA
jgi:hypothetical protein